MIDIKTVDDIYPAVEEIIERLRAHPISKLSAILDHRMHKVAWTTRDELLEELHKVFSTAITEKEVFFDLEIRNQIDMLLRVIKHEIQ